MIVLNGIWRVDEWVQENVATEASDVAIEFRGNQLFWPTMKGDGTRIVNEIELQADSSPPSLVTRFVGFERGGVCVPLGQNAPKGRMTFEMEGDRLRIGYANGSTRLLKPEELHEPKGRVVLVVCSRITSPPPVPE